jgi:hypothetical protein
MVSQSEQKGISKVKGNVQGANKQIIKSFKAVTKDGEARKQNNRRKKKS